VGRTVVVHGAVWIRRWISRSEGGTPDTIAQAVPRPYNQGATFPGLMSKVRRRDGLAPRSRDSLAFTHHHAEVRYHFPDPAMAAKLHEPTTRAACRVGGGAAVAGVSAGDARGTGRAPGDALSRASRHG